MLQLARTTCLQRGFPSLHLRPVPFATASIRGLSINSAIHRGIRESRDPPISRTRKPRYGRNDGEDFRDPQREWRPRTLRDNVAESAYKENFDQDRRAHDNQSRKVDDDNGQSQYHGPVAVPHKTASSQFIYGFSAVVAALKAQRRKFYTLYLHKRAVKRDQTDDEVPIQKLLTALPLQVVDEIIHVGDDKLPMLDQMSEGRPHNGIVLEASPLPMFSANYLDVVSRGRPYFTVRGKDDQRFSYNSHGWRFPFILYLDGIKDSGNMGAIIRSAYYLGVDAIFTSSRATAPVDSVTIKASAGAAEVVPIGTVVKPQDFLAESRKHGWRVYAADAPEPPRENFNVTESHRRTSLDPENTSPLVQIRHLNDTRLLPLHSPVLFHPTMLMMGGEGDGLSIRLKRLADYLVGIRGVKGEAIAMDSLNVSVAAAMLSLEFLKKPSDKLKQRARQQFAEPRKPKRDDGFLF